MFNVNLALRWTVNVCYTVQGPWRIHLFQLPLVASQVGLLSLLCSGAWEACLAPRAPVPLADLYVMICIVSLVLTPVVLLQHAVAPSVRYQRFGAFPPFEFAAAA